MPNIGESLIIAREIALKQKIERKANKSRKNKVVSNPFGAPTKMTPDRLEKILEAVKRGYNRVETAAYAGITTMTLLNYERTHPEFIEAQEAAKTVLIAKARENVYNKINDGDIDVSKWLLERKCKDEYSTRTESKIDGEVKHTLDNQGLPTLMERITAEIHGAGATDTLQAPSED